MELKPPTGAGCAPASNAAPAGEANDKQRLVIALIVAAGLFIRTLHYLRDPSMWHDEAALVLNVLGKNYRELLGPLYFAEAAPPLFLWLERTVALLLGDSTYALRLLPFLASCAVLLLMVPLARAVLSPRAVPWALVFCAFSDRLLWHSAEAKPYAFDLLAATLLALLFVETQAWPVGRRARMYCLLSPLVIFLVYPGGFLMAGVILALLPEVWRRRERSAIVSYTALCAAAAVSFFLLVIGPARAQRCGPMDACWTDFFPSWDRPASVPGWALNGTLDLFEYCYRPVGGVLALFAAAGGAALWRSGRRDLVLLLGTPVALAFLGSLAGAYPYGGSRVTCYAAGAIFLTAAAGVAAAREWLAPRCKPAALALTGVLAFPAALSVYRVAVPWPRADCSAAATYVLTQCRPGDAITANHWEYLYYFRGAGPQFRWRPAGTQVTPALDSHSDTSTLWLVMTGRTTGEREAVRPVIEASGWTVTGRKEYRFTSVFRLQRPPLTVTGPPAPRQQTASVSKKDGF